MVFMADNIKKTEQKILLINRNKLSLSGIEKVLSAKDDLIQVVTIEDGIIISGSGLQVTKLDQDSGLADIDGKVDSIRFSTSQKESFWKRIFK